MQNGIENIKIYSMVKCSGDGLVMTKNMWLLLVLMQKTSGLTIYVYWNSLSMYCPYMK